MAQGQLRYQSPHHGWQLMKAGNKELIYQSAGSSTGWKTSFSGSPVALRPFQTAGLVSIPPR